MFAAHATNLVPTMQYGLWRSERIPRNFSSRLTDPSTVPPASETACERWRLTANKRFAVAWRTASIWGGRHISESRRLLRSAERLLQFTMQEIENPIAPFVVPCEDGSLQLEWHTSTTEFEFYFRADGSYAAWVRDLQNDYELEAEGAKAIELLGRWASRLVEEPAVDINECDPAPIPQEVQLIGA